MNVNDLLIEAFDRLPELVRSAVEGLSPEQLLWSPAPGANSVGWLVWHLTRVQDDHVAEIVDQDQVWVSGDWARRFGLDADPSNSGYGHSAEPVAGQGTAARNAATLSIRSGRSSHIQWPARSIISSWTSPPKASA